MVQCHLNVNCGKLKTYTVYPNTSTKIAKQRVIANESKKEIKFNHKTASIN